jgi:carboxyl-terminal processing protease
MKILLRLPLCTAFLLFTLSTATAEDDATLAKTVIEGVTQSMSLLSTYRLPFDPDAMQSAILESVVKTLDPEGGVLSAESYASRRNRLEGMTYRAGVQIDLTNDYPVIRAVLPDSPAASLGLEAGDIIESINSDDAGTLSYREIVLRLRGPAEETVHLEVQKPGTGTNAEWDVARALLPLPAIERIEELPEDIGLVWVNSLRDGVAGQIREQLIDWDTRTFSGAILDCRGASGTNLTAVREVAELFAPADAFLFSFRDRYDQDIEVFNGTNTGSLSLPVMVLVDEETGGSAEVLAAVLKKSTRGVMVLGNATRGSFLVREALPLPSGEYLYIATRKLVVADGTIYEGRKGMKPDIVMPAGIRQPWFASTATDSFPNADEKQKQQLLERVQNDPALGRAVDLLLGLKALNIRRGENSGILQDK